MAASKEVQHWEKWIFFLNFRDFKKNISRAEASEAPLKISDYKLVGIIIYSKTSVKRPLS